MSIFIFKNKKDREREILCPLVYPAFRLACFLFVKVNCIRNYEVIGGEAFDGAEVLHGEDHSVLKHLDIHTLSYLRRTR